MNEIKSLLETVFQGTRFETKEKIDWRKKFINLNAKVMGMFITFKMEHESLVLHLLIDRRIW